MGAEIAGQIVLRSSGILGSLWLHVGLHLTGALAPERLHGSLRLTELYALEWQARPVIGEVVVPLAVVVGALVNLCAKEVGRLTGVLLPVPVSPELSFLVPRSTEWLVCHISLVVRLYSQV